MNKLAEWVEENCTSQRKLARVLDISTSSLHDILRSGKTPSLKVAYAIEKFTKGEVKMYHWVINENEIHEIGINEKIDMKNVKRSK